MKREDLLKEMKDMVGNKDPILFFEKMVDLYSLLFDKIDKLESTLNKVKANSALSIQWDPRAASDMITKQVQILRQDKDTYSNEISALKQAFVDDKVTQNYIDFCEFWTDCLGWHPFLDYER